MKKLLTSALALSVIVCGSVAFAAGSGEKSGNTRQTWNTGSYTNITNSTTPSSSQSQNWTANSQTTPQASRQTSQSVDISALGYGPRGKDFSNQNLTHARFNRDKLAGANFRQAILTNSSFRGASLINADFNGAMLMGADFRWAKLNGADLSNADLTNVRTWGAKFQDAKYNRNTKFPVNFVPEKRGMIKVD